MKHITFTSVLTILACSISLRANTEVEWAKVCAASQGHQMIVTTTTGESVQGYCTSIEVDEIALRTDKQVVRIAKSKISGLRVHRVRGHQFSSLWREVGGGVRYGTGLLFSPYAPVGLVWVPGTVAWGAVATPFCLLADVADRMAGEKVIKVK